MDVFTAAPRSPAPGPLAAAWRPVLAAVLGLGLAACQSSGGAGRLLTGGEEETLSIAAGHKLTFGPFARVDAECRVVGQARARILEQARNGRAKVSRETGSIAFEPGTRLARCNERPISGTTVTYRLGGKEPRADSFVYSLVFPDGERRVKRIWIVPR